MSWGVRDLLVRHGATIALRGVSLDVTPATVTAVVGGDGAGKTTLLRVLTGTIAPTGGSVRRPEQTRIGVQTEVPGVWPDLTVDEHVRFAADAYGVDLRIAERRAGLLLRVARLGGTRDRLGRALSGGMRQKLAVVLALLHGPVLVVLDEPTTGVDPVSRAELWRLVTHAAADGAAVLLSTTYLDEAERAGQVLVLHEGEPLLQGPPEELGRGGPLEAAVVERQRRLEREAER